MSSFDRTMELARELDYKIEWIERDCVHLRKDDECTWFEVEFDENRPTFPFWSATEIHSRLKFHSYAGIRKFMQKGTAERESIRRLRTAG